MAMTAISARPATVPFGTSGVSNRGSGMSSAGAASASG